jgi:hypothetical protein
MSHFVEELLSRNRLPAVALRDRFEQDRLQFRAELKRVFWLVRVHGGNSTLLGMTTPHPSFCSNAGTRKGFT